MGSMAFDNELSWSFDSQGYHLVQQQRQQNRQHIMGIQLRTKFNTEKKSKSKE